MRNRGLKIVGGLVAFLLVAFIVLNLTIDAIVKSGIEENGSELLQTEVNIDDVDISILNGTGSISGLIVSNPAAFSDEPAISIKDASIKLDISTLLSDIVVINKVIVEDPRLFFEQKGAQANLKTLNDNMGYSSDESSETALVIEHLLIKNGTVKVSTTIDRKRTAEASFAEFELEGIGRDGSNTVKQSLRQVIRPLLERAIAEAITGGVMEQLEKKAKDFISE